MQWQRGQAPLPHGKGAAAAGAGGGGSKARDAGDSDGGMLHAAAQEVFRVALFAVFFLQVSAVAFVPLIGAQPAPVSAVHCKPRSRAVLQHNLLPRHGGICMVRLACPPLSRFRCVSAPCIRCHRDKSTRCWWHARHCAGALRPEFFFELRPMCCAGNAAYFVLVSWLYALYSFDYKWSLTSRRLQERIAFFEQHWAFFLGAPRLCAGSSACVASHASSASGMHARVVVRVQCRGEVSCAR